MRAGAAGRECAGLGMRRTQPPPLSRRADLARAPRGAAGDARRPGHGRRFGPGPSAASFSLGKRPGGKRRASPSDPFSMPSRVPAGGPFLCGGPYSREGLLLCGPHSLKGWPPPTARRAAGGRVAAPSLSQGGRCGQQAGGPLAPRPAGCTRRGSLPIARRIRRARSAWTRRRGRSRQAASGGLLAHQHAPGEKAGRRRLAGGPDRQPEGAGRALRPWPGPRPARAPPPRPRAHRCLRHPGQPLERRDVARRPGAKRGSACRSPRLRLQPRWPAL